MLRFFLFARARLNAQSLTLACSGIHNNDILPEGAAPFLLDEDIARAAAEGEARLTAGDAASTNKVAARGAGPAAAGAASLQEGKRRSVLKMKYTSLKRVQNCVYLVCICSYVFCDFHKEQRLYLFIYAHIYLYRNAQM